ncbi:sporulation histidine kinase inhibitor Sda [Paenibacillus cisolokensis]|uniref:sporulation histidine kinase inhibitor Sda n=1 Tax=Paenibacillus cisolokensis TaxID=1658519 RepID=UPI003D2B2761
MKLINPLFSTRKRTQSISRSLGRDEHLIGHQEPQSASGDGFLPMQDKTMLLRPLNDTHLLEVYKEAKAMQLSEEFIRLIEVALQQRNIPLDKSTGA